MSNHKVAKTFCTVNRDRIRTDAEAGVKQARVIEEILGEPSYLADDLVQAVEDYKQARPLPHQEWVPEFPDTWPEDLLIAPGQKKGLQHTAYQRGWTWRRLGRPRNKNPYDEVERAKHYWIRGWDDADAFAKKRLDRNYATHGLA